MRGKSSHLWHATESAYRQNANTVARIGQDRFSVMGLDDDIGLQQPPPHDPRVMAGRSSVLGDFYFDSPRFSLVVLGQMYHQNTVFELGIDLLD